MSTTVNRKLRLRANDALQRSPVPALRHLTLVETGDELILDGRLPSQQYRQMAQDLVLPFLNGRTLVNRISISAGE